MAVEYTIITSTGKEEIPWDDILIWEMRVFPLSEKACMLTNHLCEEYSMDFEEMKKWYDGYSFNRVKSVYSPNSVIEAIKTEEISNYWTETETYESLKVYIDMDEDGLKETIIQMLGGASCPIDIGTFQNDMTSIQSKDDVLTLLVHLGYLAYDLATKSVFIPNEEVRQEFIRAVKASRHTEVAKMILASDQLLRDTLSMNDDQVAKAIQAAHSAVNRFSIVEKGCHWSFILKSER